jgi:hypothetical protein
VYTYFLSGRDRDVERWLFRVDVADVDVVQGVVAVAELDRLAGSHEQ